MLQADADVLLIDEVLAVGDAAFQQKCADTFHTMKAEGKTIVLVTHEMATVERYCHRAMLIEGGQILGLGDPAEVARRYLRLNFEGGDGAGGADDGANGAGDVSLREVWLEDAAGERVKSLEHGEKIRLRVDLEVKREMTGLHVGFTIANGDGVALFQFGTPVDRRDGGDAVAGGERVRIAADIDNLLPDGHYFVHCGGTRDHGGSSVMQQANALDFVVFGGPRGLGVVELPHEIEAVIEEGVR
jgi:ABC-type sugar transport system ATPase subunit